MAESLIFIPDISGFTEFVNNTEISHSQHIISELLDLIIESDELDMEVAEIEGDAVLFIKRDTVPSIGEIIQQTEKMFIGFHRHLLQYDVQRICNCGACSTAHQLSLKVIVHGSELGYTQVKDAKKPFGPGLITAHRLLKNSIQDHEYLLFSNAFTEDFESFDDKSLPLLTIQDGSTQYEDLGYVKYKYILLRELRGKINSDDPLPSSPMETDPVVIKGEIQRPAAFVFEVISNLDYRLAWNKGLKELKYNRDRLNRAGMKHVCVFSGSQVEIETIQGKEHNNPLVFGERTDDIAFLKDLTTYYILEDLEKTTRVRIEIYFSPNSFFSRLLLPYLKFNAKKIANSNFLLLKNYCEQDPELEKIISI